MCSAPASLQTVSSTFIPADRVPPVLQPVLFDRRFERSRGRFGEGGQQDFPVLIVVVRVERPHFSGVRLEVLRILLGDEINPLRPDSLRLLVKKLRHGIATVRHSLLRNARPNAIARYHDRLRIGLENVQHAIVSDEKTGPEDRNLIDSFGQDFTRGIT